VSAVHPLGEFEQIVVLAVLQLRRGAYPTAVGSLIASRTGRRVLRGAVYITLDRLERKGLLRSRRCRRQGTTRPMTTRVYKATTAGVQAVGQALRSLQRMSSGLPQAWPE
jgi:PadR family transcriptional regulator PadR